MSKRHVNASIDAAAAAWVARRDRGALSPETEAALDAWLAADPRHLGAYARASAVFARLERARALGPRYDPGDFDEAAGTPPDAARRHFLWATGAAVAASVTGAVLLRRPGRHIGTRLGEILRVPLDDGSVVTLNSATAITVEFGSARRLVRLLRGEALFDVASDALRPFVVDADQARVVAVGTSFTVHRALGDAVEVMVREGIVEIAAELAHVRPIRVLANTLALARPDNPVTVEPLRPIEISRKLAWRDGMISFEGDTLAQAATQFARYSDVRIVIDDPVVAKLRVVGLYSATDPAGFAHAVALSMNLRAERNGDVVHLRSGKAG